MFDWGAPVLVTKSFIVRIAPLLTGRHTVLELYISCSYFQRIGEISLLSEKPLLPPFPFTPIIFQLHTAFAAVYKCRQCGPLWDLNWWAVG